MTLVSAAAVEISVLAWDAGRAGGRNMIASITASSFLWYQLTSACTFERATASCTFEGVHEHAVDTPCRQSPGLRHPQHLGDGEEIPWVKEQHHPGHGIVS